MLLWTPRGIHPFPSRNYGHIQIPIWSGSRRHANASDLEYVLLPVPFANLLKLFEQLILGLSSVSATDDQTLQTIPIVHEAAPFQLALLPGIESGEDRSGQCQYGHPTHSKPND